MRSKGIKHAFWTQRNIRIHLITGAIVFRFGVFLRLDRYELIALIITIGFVIMSEMVNTAIEEIVDLALPAGMKRP